MTLINDNIRLVKDAPPFVIQVFELAAVERPAEDRDDGQHQRGRQRDQEVEAFHGQSRNRRSELPTTTTELSAMPRPAAHGGTQPSAAAGMAIEL